MIVDKKINPFEGSFVRGRRHFITSIVKMSFQRVGPAKFLATVATAMENRARDVLCFVVPLAVMRSGERLPANFACKPLVTIRIYSCRRGACRTDATWTQNRTSRGVTMMTGVLAWYREGCGGLRGVLIMHRPRIVYMSDLRRGRDESGVVRGSIV